MRAKFTRQRVTFSCQHHHCTQVAPSLKWNACSCPDKEKLLQRVERGNLRRGRCIEPLTVEPLTASSAPIGAAEGAEGSLTEDHLVLCTARNSACRCQPERYCDPLSTAGNRLVDLRDFHSPKHQCEIRFAAIFKNNPSLTQRVSLISERQRAVLGSEWPESGRHGVSLFFDVPEPARSTLIASCCGKRNRATVL